MTEDLPKGTGDRALDRDDWLLSVLGAPPVLDGKYRLEERLGGGAMGVVYRALHVGLQRRFALKLIRPRRLVETGSFQRFRQEAELLGGLDHPNIVRVTDFGVDPRGGGVPYLVMEHLEGRTLEQELDQPLSWDAIRGILSGLASGLDFAHRQGVLHADLKPSNVMVEQGDGARSVKILDFGLARLREPGLPSPGRDRDLPRVAGTPSYLAPELTRGGDPTVASDLYSLGVIAYRLHTGHCPFEGSRSEVLRGHLSDPPPRPSSLRPELAPELDAALVALLAKDPARRPSAAAALVAAIEDAHQRACRRRFLAREAPRRAAIAVAVGGLLSALVWWAPPPGLDRLEGWTNDARFAVAAPRAPDPRLLLVSLDDDSLAVDPTPLVERSEEFGQLISAIFAAGARAVAVDLLLPESWGRSESFGRLVLEHSDRLTLAAATTPDGSVIGPESTAGLIAGVLGPERVSELFAFVNLSEDADGTVRRSRFADRDVAGGLRPTLASRLVAPVMPDAARAQPSPEVFLLDFTVDTTRFERLSWSDLPSTLQDSPSRFAGRLVLVGGEFTGSGDFHRVPTRAGTPRMSGLELQAVAAETLLARTPIVRPSSAWLSVTLGLLLAANVASFILAHRWWLGWLTSLALPVAYLGASLAVFVQARWMIPVVGPLVALALSWLVGLATRRLLAPAPPPVAMPVRSIAS